MKERHRKGRVRVSILQLKPCQKKNALSKIWSMCLYPVKMFVLVGYGSLRGMRLCSRFVLCDVKGKIKQHAEYFWANQLQQHCSHTSSSCPPHIHTHRHHNQQGANRTHKWVPLPSRCLSLRPVLACTWTTSYKHSFQEYTTYLSPVFILSAYSCKTQPASCCGKKTDKNKQWQYSMQRIPRTVLGSFRLNFFIAIPAWQRPKV